MSKEKKRAAEDQRFLLESSALATIHSATTKTAATSPRKLKEITFGNVPMFFSRRAEDFPTLEEAEASAKKGGAATTKKEEAATVHNKPTPLYKENIPATANIPVSKNFLSHEIPHFVNTKKQGAGPVFAKLEAQNLRLPPDPVCSSATMRPFQIAGEETHEERKKSMSFHSERMGQEKQYIQSHRRSMDYGWKTGRMKENEAMKSNRKYSLGEIPENRKSKGKPKCSISGKQVATFTAVSDKVTL